MRFKHCSSLISLQITKTVANSSVQRAFIPLTTFCRYMRSVQCVKNEAHCLGPVSNVFWINDIKRCQTGYSLENRIVRPKKVATVWPTNGNHFFVTPNEFRRKPLVFKEVKNFLVPPIWLAPQTHDLVPPLLTVEEACNCTSERNSLFTNNCEAIAKCRYDDKVSFPVQRSLPEMSRRS